MRNTNWTVIDKDDLKNTFPEKIECMEFEWKMQGWDDSKYSIFTIKSCTELIECIYNYHHIVRWRKKALTALEILSGYFIVNVDEFKGHAVHALTCVEENGSILFRMMDVDDYSKKRCTINDIQTLVDNKLWEYIPPHLPKEKE